MKNKRLLPIAGLFACTILTAQDSTSIDDTEVFELSPFVVDAADSEGYMATNTLAGTRLKTNLDEVGTAISIITEEFMQDTGATDAESLLFYTTNAEVGGSQGNWAGGIVSGRVNQTSARTSPQYNQRIRGLTAAELTRDYFRSSIPFDGYNTTRVTLNRGPNAILFGIGSAGGVVNNTTRQALLNQSSTNITFRFGDNGSHREVLDYNYPVIKNRLSVRFSLMNENEQFRQEPAFEKDQRAFLALTGILNEGVANGFLGKTILRANFETADSVANPVNPIPPNDSYTDWFTMDHTLPAEKYQALGIAVPAWTYNGNFTPKWTQWGDQGGWGKTSLGYPYFRQLGVFFAPENGGEPGFGISGSNLDGGQGTTTNGPGYKGHFQSTRAMYGTTPYVGFTVPVITDRNVFDYNNHLFSGDLNRRWMDYDVRNIRLEQLFWDGKAGLELAWNNEDFANKAFMPFAGGEGTQLGFADVFVDINKSLNNSTNNAAGVVLNPNVGRPMARQIGLQTSYNNSEWDAYRITAYVQIDARDYLGDRLGWWLGNHTINGNYSDETNSLFSHTDGLGWDGNFEEGSPYTSGYAWSAANNGPGNWGRSVVALAYVGDSMLDLDDPSQARFHPIVANLPQAGDVYRMFYKDSATNTVKEGDFLVSNFTNWASMQEINIRSRAGSLHSKFLDDHLITLVGWRYDEQAVRQEFDFDNDGDDSTNNRYFDPESGLYDAGWNLEQMRLQEESEIEGGHSVSYSIVGRFPERLLFDLPFKSDLSLFYNYSDSFDPGGRRISVRGDLLESPIGETTEYGFMLDMFDKKLSIRANWFETKEDGRTYPGGVGGAVNWSLNNISNWVQRMSQAQYEGERPFYDPDGPIDPVTGPEDALRRMYTRYEQGSLSSINIPAQPNVFVNGDGQTVTVNSYEQMYELLASLIPEPVRSRYALRFDPVEGGVVTADFGNRVATVNTVAEGFELDITGNPIRGLRLTANVGFQETTLNDVAPVLTGLANEIVANINRSGLAGLRDTPNGEEGSTYYNRYESRVLTTLAAEKTKEGQVSQEQRKWRVNFVSNYSFARDSWLRGFGIGGAIRWQSEIATGYPQFRNEAGLVVPILDQAFEDDAVWSGDIWFSYEKKLGNGIDWQVQLNIGNAFGDDDPIVTTRNPNGEIAVIRFSPPTRVFLTNTLRF